MQHATSGHIDQLVIEAVVRIAFGLGKETIAEFVTDERTERMVGRLGVDYAQGFHIGTPVPIQALLNNTIESRTDTVTDGGIAQQLAVATGRVGLVGSAPRQGQVTSCRTVVRAAMSASDAAIAAIRPAAGMNGSACCPETL